MPRNKSALNKDIVKHEEVIPHVTTGIPPNRIRIIRIASDMDIKKLADLIDISPSMLQQIETQKKSLSTEILMKVSCVFDLSTDYILYQTSTIKERDYNTSKETNIVELKNFLNKKGDY